VFHQVPSFVLIDINYKFEYMLRMHANSIIIFVLKACLSWVFLFWMFINLCFYELLAFLEIFSCLACFVFVKLNNILNCLNFWNTIHSSSISCSARLWYKFAVDIWKHAIMAALEGSEVLLGLRFMINCLIDLSFVHPWKTWVIVVFIT